MVHLALVVASVWFLIIAGRAFFRWTNSLGSDARLRKYVATMKRDSGGTPDDLDWADDAHGDRL
jgi:hypothetical protein